MPVSMHRASVGVYTQMLTALSAILDRAAAFADTRKIDPAIMLQTRLYPDMFPLGRQIQLATDHAKGATARLAGIEIPKFPDVETTFDELKARIARIVEFIDTADQAAFAGAGDREITLKFGGNEQTMRGDDYLFSNALPNFFFHVTTAYDILRHIGLDLGKRDFMGR